MRLCFRLFPLWLIGVANAASSIQQTGLEMSGVVISVENGLAAKKYLKGVKLSLVGLGVDAKTDHKGYFEMKLPPDVIPGQETTLEHNVEGYYILFPVMSKLRVPPPGTTDVEVSMAPIGAKVVLGSNFIEEFIKYTAADSAKKPKSKESGPTDLSSYVNELARQSGRPAEEMLGQIGQWVTEAKESDDPRKLGLAAFAEKKFRLAAKNFARAADAEKKRGAEGFRKSATDRTLEGDALRNALDLDQSLRAYQVALDDLNIYRKARDELRLSPDSEYARDILALRGRISLVKGELGIQLEGPTSGLYLQEALQEGRELLQQTSKTADSRSWTAIQQNLALVLKAMSDRSVGSESKRYLEETVTAYRDVLEVWARLHVSQESANTQNSMAAALKALSERTSGSESMKYLEGAIAAYKSALAVYTRDQFPVEWANCQNGLGGALHGLASRTSGPESMRHLTEAVEGYRSALAETRERAPRTWARSQNNLGLTLSDLAKRTTGPESIRYSEEAVEACHAALNVLTRPQLSQDWATAQNSLGFVLRELASRTSGPAAVKHLEEAAAAHRSAQEVYTRDRFPPAFARCQNHLGLTLVALAEGKTGPIALKHLEEAVASHRSAVEVYTREESAPAWVTYQGNLGWALLRLAERTTGAKSVWHSGEAVDVFLGMLKVVTRQHSPEDVGVAQAGLGLALRGLADRSERPSARTLLAASVHLYRSTLAVYVLEQLSQNRSGAIVNVYVALENLFCAHQFRDGLSLIAVLRQVEDLSTDPLFSIPTNVLTIAFHRVLAEDAEVSQRLDTLISLLESQKAPFPNPWSFESLRKNIEKDQDKSVAVCRDFLLKLLDAESKPTREQMLAELKALRKPLPGATKSSPAAK